MQLIQAWLNWPGGGSADNITVKLLYRGTTWVPAGIAVLPYARAGRYELTMRSDPPIQVDAVQLVYDGVTVEGAWVELVEPGGYLRLDVPAGSGRPATIDVRDPAPPPPPDGAPPAPERASLADLWPAGLLLGAVLLGVVAIEAGRRRPAAARAGG